jgi:formate C-acetyltransferase
LPVSGGSSDEARAAAIRRRILAEKVTRPSTPGTQFVMTDYRSLQASEGQPRRIRRGLRTRDRLAAIRFEVDACDRLAGRPVVDLDQWPAGKGGRLPDALHAEAVAYLGQFGPEPGQTGHCELDRSRAFRLGLAALRTDLDARAARARGARQETYRAFALAVEGLTLMIDHAADAVEAALPLAAPVRQTELRALAESCRRIARQPPVSFLDALHLLWLIDLGVQASNNAGLTGPGHLDRTLRPYFRRDLARGALSRDEALALIEALYFHINDFIPDGLAIPVMVGGRDARGRDLTNELSYLSLEALRRTNLVYPTVGVCWHEGTPVALTDLAVGLIAQGYATPAFFGDETIQRGLREYGVPARETGHYINSACVEITPVGASNVWVASPYFSTCRILLEELAVQAEGGAKAASSFDAFLDAYLARLSGKIREEGVLPQNEARELRRANGGKPLQSVFTRDCVRRGADIDEGGARYNWVECSFVGLANLADALFVIREEVYCTKRLTLAELNRLLASDFKGYEAERQRFLNAYPKYGNANPEVDGLVALVVGRVRQECARYRMAPDDSPFVPGSFCWIMHERLGSECGATPDGRRAGFPFADGGGPAQGREKGGPTAAILSTTSWDHAPMIGGVAYNMRFNRGLFRGSGTTDRLRDLVVTFLRRGGFETQITVLDHETLRRARENPDPYRDLVVRIGGYTDYFTRLSPSMQDEVMLRTEFNQAQ